MTGIAGVAKQVYMNFIQQFWAAHVSSESRSPAQPASSLLVSYRKILSPRSNARPPTPSAPRTNPAPVRQTNVWGKRDARSFWERSQHDPTSLRFRLFALIAGKTFVIYGRTARHHHHFGVGIDESSRREPIHPALAVTVAAGGIEH
jgi:hypothetical protein